MPRNRAKGGLFREAPTPNIVPAKFSITGAQGFLHALAKASARHPASRFQILDEVTQGVEGGSRMSVTPAGSQEELRDQIARLSIAFERSEGRPPSDRDDAFWEAVNTLFEAYQGPTLGSVEDVMGGLS
jgi:hypothetical protein